MRRAWLRGRENIQKRYLIHIAGYNLSLIMRLLTGSGTPRRWANANIAIIWLNLTLDGTQNANPAILGLITDGIPIAAIVIVSMTE